MFGNNFRDSETEEAAIAAHLHMEREAGRVVMDDEDALRAEYEEKYHTLYQVFAKAFRLLVAYQDNQTDPRMMRMSTRAMAMIFQFRVAAGADSYAELARICGLGKTSGSSGKATVQKCAELFFKHFSLPPLPGQRGQAGRGKMAEARNKQVVKHECNGN